MIQMFPYTYYACSCRDSNGVPTVTNSKHSSQFPNKDDEDEEETFDPTNPRSNYKLFPLEHLLYCTDCHEIRCPRCITEEVVCWYCPNCLFEVPSSSVRSEGNRCTRNCYNCPVCTSILSISSLEKPLDGLAPPDSDHKQLGGPYFLSCPYCQWSSLDIGIQFEKHFNLTAQLAKLFKKELPIRSGSSASGPSSPTKDADIGASYDKRASIGSMASDGRGPMEEDQSEVATDHDSRFANLHGFYRAQIAQLSDSGNPYGLGGVDFSYNSPSSLTRLMNLYTSSGSGSRVSKRDKPRAARDAARASEGLHVFDPSSELETIQRMQTGGWAETTSREQRTLQCREAARFVDDLRPLATPLRTKRSKRCRACRQILTRPEQKVSSTRYKIKLLALTNVPKLTLRPLQPSAPLGNPSFPMNSASMAASDLYSLRPLSPTQLLLTLTNPLFDPIRVHLATPSVAPSGSSGSGSRVRSRVTILCPEFDVGAAADVWDAEIASAMSERSSKRASQMLPGSGSGDGTPSGTAAAGAGVTAEAGKVWARGRNWTSVVVEVVPGALPGSAGYVRPPPASGGDGDADEWDDGLGEDEDVLEIAVFVRIEYETEAGGDGDDDGGGSGGARRRAAAAATAATGGTDAGGGSGKQKREEAFWAVLGAGRIMP